MDSEPLIHAESIEQQLQQTEDPVLLEEVIKLVSEKSNHLITVGFINTTTGECQTLFQLISEAKVIQSIVSAICCGNVLYSTIGKKVLEDFCFIDLSRDVGYLIGTTMNMIGDEEIQMDDKQQQLAEIMTTVETCLLTTEMRKDIMFVIRNIERDWKQMTTEMKSLFVTMNKETSVFLT